MRDVNSDYDTAPLSRGIAEEKFKKVMSFMDRTFFGTALGWLALLLSTYDAVFTALLWFMVGFTAILITLYMARPATCRFISTVYRTVSPKMGSRRRGMTILAVVSGIGTIALLLIFTSFVVHILLYFAGEADTAGAEQSAVFVWMFAVGIFLFSGILERILEED